MTKSSNLTPDLELPTPLKDWMAKKEFNNPQCAKHFGFSTPAIQKMLCSNREIGVLIVGISAFIVETKKIEVLMTFQSGAGQAFELPESMTIIQIVEPRGPRKVKDAEG